MYTEYTDIRIKFDQSINHQRFNIDWGTSKCWKADSIQLKRVIIWSALEKGKNRYSASTATCIYWKSIKKYAQYCLQMGVQEKRLKYKFKIIRVYRKVLANKKSKPQSNFVFRVVAKQNKNIFLAFLLKIFLGKICALKYTKFYANYFQN